MNAEMLPRPVLRYHGGKYVLAKWIISHFPEHRCYVESFCGAASVMINKPRCYAEVISDLDGEIVNLFRVLRDPMQARELERILRLTPFARAEFEMAYLPHGDPIESARRAVVRSFMGFGAQSCSFTKPTQGGFRAVRCRDELEGKPTTGFRANTTRSRTTPAHDWANWPDVIEAFCKRLRGVVVENLPAAEIMRRHDTKNTLHYCDPPYPKSTRSDKGDDYRFEMSDDDHRHLAADLKQLDGMVVLSGYPCDLYDIELFADWHRVTRDTFADGAGKRTECLWLNAAAWERLQAPTTGLFAGVQS